MSESYLLSLLTFSPLLGVLLLAFVPRHRARIVKAVAVLATLPPLALALALYANFDYARVGLQFTETYDWITIPVGEQGIPIQYELGIDGLSLPLALLTAILAPLVALASLAIQKRWKEYFILYLLMEVGMLGVFTAQNLLLFFLFFELALIPFFFLMAIWGSADRERAAFKFLLYNGLGSLILLLAFVAVFMSVGTMSFTEIASRLTDPESPFNAPEMQAYVSETMRVALFAAIMLAFAIKLPVVPLHTWIMKAYQEAPVPMVMISSGVLVKMGAYGMLRMGVGFFPETAVGLADVLALFGLLNVLYGAVLAFVQKDLKLVLAYSSISHMGIVLFGIAAMNEAGFQGAIFQMVSHGLIASLLFFLVGVIEERTGTSAISELGGLAKAMPFASGIFLAAAMASLGLPGMSGFVGEFLAYLGLFQSQPTIAAIGALGLILTAAYLLRAVLATTFGRMPEKWQSLADAAAVEAVPMIVLLGLVILLGVFPAVLNDPILTTVETIVPGIGG
ncbi:NADH-quinone oxidoreductase subunit M [Bacillaceae bacterium]